MIRTAPAYGPERREHSDRREKLESIFKVSEITDNDNRKLGRRVVDDS